jgi:hypothetical protein
MYTPLPPAIMVVCEGEPLALEELLECWTLLDDHLALVAGKPAARLLPRTTERTI